MALEELLQVYYDCFSEKSGASEYHPVRKRCSNMLFFHFFRNGKFKTESIGDR